MPASISTAFIQQFSSNIYNLAQQKGSRLRGAVRNESIKGDSGYFERLGLATAQEKAGQHTDMPLLDIVSTRNRLSLTDFEWASLVDTEDKLRLLIDPVSEYSKAAMNALGRSMDDVIIAALLGDAHRGSAGGTSTALTAAQHIGCVSGGALSGLNVATLRKVKQLFDANDVPEAGRHIAISSVELQALLGQTEVVNSDYATVKALVMGDVDSFLGFNFHRLERLPTNASPFRASSSFVGTINTASGAVTLSTGNGDALRRCVAWQEDGIILGLGAEPQGSIDRRVDKSGIPWQASARMSIGAERMEEAMVVCIVSSLT